MLTPKIVAVVGWAVNFGYRFTALPFSWDDKSHKMIHLPKLRWNLQLLPWYLKVLMIWLHTIFVVIRIIYSEIVNPSEQRIMLILSMTYAFLNLLPGILLLNIVFRKNEILMFINNTVRLMLNLQGKYVLENVGFWKRKRWEQLMLFTKRQTYLCPTTFMIIMWQYPNNRFFLTSLISQELVPKYFWIFAIFYYWLLLTVWGVLIFHFFLCLVAHCTFLFLIAEIRPRKRSKLTKAGIRKPKVAAFIYRCIQILMNQLNFCFNKVVMYLLGITIVICILNLYAVGKLGDSFPKYFVGIHTILSTCMFLIILHSYAYMYHTSRALIRKWIYWRKKTSYVRLYWRSRQPLKLRVGSLCWIEYATVLKIITIITVTAGKLLIM